MTDQFVYRDFTQAALDRAYDQRSLVPDINGYLEGETAGTALARSNLPCRLGLSYGQSDAEFVDVYGQGDGNAPMVIFFHGGAWRMMSADNSGAGANSLVPSGALFAVVNFALAPDVSLDQMVRQCRAGTAFLHRSALEFGGDGKKIFVSGHSSGGHLAAMVAATEWDAGFDLPAGLVKGLTVVSGVYDLQPVRLSARNDYLHLDAEAARRNSPARFLDRLPDRVIVAWGGGELDEFQRQGAEFADALILNGNPMSRIFIKDRHHFEMGAELYRVGGPIFAAMADQMGLPVTGD
jgi:arylformamidase